MMPLTNHARYQRFSKNPLPVVGPGGQGLSYAQASQWAGCVKSTIGKWLRPDAVDRTGAVGGQRTGTGWLMDAHSRRRRGIEVIRDSNTGAALGAFGRWAEAPGGISNQGGVAVGRAAYGATGQRWRCGHCGGD